MKMDKAMRLIELGCEVRPTGYRVHFERRDPPMLVSDFFPDRGEDLIESLEEAWRLAESFAAYDPDKYVNVYVIDERFSPVEGYINRKLNVYPPPTNPSGS